MFRCDALRRRKKVKKERKKTPPLSLLALCLFFFLLSSGRRSAAPAAARQPKIAPPDRQEEERSPLAVVRSLFALEIDKKSEHLLSQFFSSSFLETTKTKKKFSAACPSLSTLRHLSSSIRRGFSLSQAWASSTALTRSRARAPRVTR